MDDDLKRIVISSLLILIWLPYFIWATKVTNGSISWWSTIIIESGLGIFSAVLYMKKHRYALFLLFITACTYLFIYGVVEASSLEAILGYVDSEQPVGLVSGWLESKYTLARGLIFSNILPIKKMLLGYDFFIMPTIQLIILMTILIREPRKLVVRRVV